MKIPMDFLDLYPFLVALLIGALIGTERQRRQAEEKSRGVAGLRTFILISLLGALCASLSSHYGPNNGARNTVHNHKTAYSTACNTANSNRARRMGTAVPHRQDQGSSREQVPLSKGRKAAKTLKNRMPALYTRRPPCPG